MSIEPNLYDDKKLAEIRANQEDPLVLYLIVRKSLNMSVGKIAPQCAHASDMVMLKYFKLLSENPNDERVLIYKTWMEESFRKVVLKADDKEWEKLKIEQHCFIVRDAGLTEVEAGSETFIGLWPMRKSQRSKLLRRLRVL